MIKIKNKEAETYTNASDIIGYNRLKYKDKYTCLSNSTDLRKNGIKIIKKNKSYNIIKSKWLKVSDYIPLTEEFYYDYSDEKMSYKRFDFASYYFKKYYPEIDYTTIKSFPYELNYLDCTELEHIGDFFSYMYELENTIIEFKDNLKHVKCFRAIFYNNNKLTDIPYIDFSNAENCLMIFSNCSSLKKINYTLNLPKINNIKAGFSGTILLEEISFSNFASNADTVNLTDMFHNSTNLKSINGFSTSKGIYCRNTFQNCSSLTSIPFEIDLISCTVCDNMFTGCPATNIVLKNVPTSLDLSNIGTTNYTVINYI